MYLLDTNVVSELRKPRPHGAVLAWLESVNDASLYLATVTLGEIQAGIELTRERIRKKAGDEAWLDLVASSYNILAMDGLRFVLGEADASKIDALYEDAMIAAMRS